MNPNTQRLCRRKVSTEKPELRMQLMTSASASPLAQAGRLIAKCRTVLSAPFAPFADATPIVITAIDGQINGPRPPPRPQAMQQLASHIHHAHF